MGITALGVVAREAYYSEHLEYRNTWDVVANAVRAEVLEQVAQEIEAHDTISISVAG